MVMIGVLIGILLAWFEEVGLFHWNPFYIEETDVSGVKRKKIKMYFIHV